MTKTIKEAVSISLGNETYSFKAGDEPSGDVPPRIIETLEAAGLLAAKKIKKEEVANEPE